MSVTTDPTTATGPHMHGGWGRKAAIGAAMVLLIILSMVLGAKLFGGHDATSTTTIDKPAAAPAVKAPAAITNAPDDIGTMPLEQRLADMDKLFPPAGAYDYIKYPTVDMTGDQMIEYANKWLSKNPVDDITLAGAALDDHGINLIKPIPGNPVRTPKFDNNGRWVYPNMVGPRTVTIGSKTAQAWTNTLQGSIITNQGERVEGKLVFRLVSYRLAGYQDPAQHLLISFIPE